MEALFEVHSNQEQRTGRINRHVATFPGIVLHTKTHKYMHIVHAWNARIPVKRLWHSVDLYVAQTNWMLDWLLLRLPVD